MIHETQRIFVTFLWGSSTYRVAQKTISLRKKHGGLVLLDLGAPILGKTFTWIIRIHFSEARKWNTVGKYLLRKFDREYGIEAFILKCLNLEGLDLSQVSPFYRQCLTAWSEFCFNEYN